MAEKLLQCDTQVALIFRKLLAQKTTSSNVKVLISSEPTLMEPTQTLGLVRLPLLVLLNYNSTKSKGPRPLMRCWN